MDASVVANCILSHIQSALGWDYQADLAKHASQTDASKGFGGKYGVQKNLKDKVCVSVVPVHVRATLGMRMYNFVHYHVQ